MHVGCPMGYSVHLSGQERELKMKFQVVAILVVGCRLICSEPIDPRWINIDEELAGSHPDIEPPAQFSLDLHMELPQNPKGGEKTIPMIKNPMWIDKLAIIKAPMYPAIQEDYDPIPINYRSSADRDIYQISKSRQRRSTQQNKKTTRNSDKKSKFKAWLETKMEKKLGEKLSEKFSKLKSFSRQTRSLDKNDIAEVKEESDNRINRASSCPICSGLAQPCRFCEASFLIGSAHPPRPQFIEFINGEPSAYIPGAHHTILGASPRYVFDQLGHRYLERDGSLQILPPSIDPIVASPPSYEYKILYDTIQRYPHFQIAHRLENGQLTESPIKQTQDFIEFIKNLAQSKNQEKNHQKRHAKDIEETIVDEDSLMELLLEQDREFEKYLEQIGFKGNIEMFDMEADEDNSSKSQSSQSIILDSPKSSSNNFQSSAKQWLSGGIKKIPSEPQRSHPRQRPQE